MGRHQREKIEIYLAFLDIEKAYDRVQKDRLLEVLSMIGFWKKVV